MKNKNPLSFILSATLFLALLIFFKNTFFAPEIEFKTIKSMRELEKIASLHDRHYRNPPLLTRIACLPFSLLPLWSAPYNDFYLPSPRLGQLPSDVNFDSFATNTIATSQALSSESTSFAPPSSDFSTTNIQVENVDEADIVKTDGRFLYAIANEQVIITQTDQNGQLNIISRLSNLNTPQDLFIHQGKLIIISYLNLGRDRSYKSSEGTMVEIYDLQNPQQPKKIKEFSITQKYYSSRLTNDHLYLITHDRLLYNRGNGPGYKVELPSYVVDNQSQVLSYHEINYLKKQPSDELTTMTTFDLEHINQTPILNAYLMPIDNLYVATKNLYLVFEDYQSRYHDLNWKNQIETLLSWGGVIGFLKNINSNVTNDENLGNQTYIIKMALEKNGVHYLNHNSVKGETLNQFSLDEYQGNLRVALSEGSRFSKIVIFSPQMKKIGSLDHIAPGEKIYAIRFMGKRAYMVTFKTIDPLFVLDLADPTSPKILGELKIPGYSTYLHPFDENHLLGIGNEVETEIRRDDFGRVISERQTITGLKMALFDITDVNHPKEKFVQKIGDRYTYSSILKNHKALLFSKEKELLAIPVNSYAQAISVSASDNINTQINLIDSLGSSYTHGYLVYQLNLKQGFKTKGLIVHEKKTTSTSYRSGYEQEIRGLYIDNILYTLSNQQIKSHRLNDLTDLSSVDVK